MIVEDMMVQDVHTLTPDATLAEAIDKMSANKIRHLPVVDGEFKVVGILTDRDIKEFSPSPFQMNGQDELLETKLQEIMRTPVITGHPLDFVEEVALLFMEERIGCLPIVSDGRLIGMITETDLLHTLIQLTGVSQPGSQIEVKVPNKAGMLYEVAGIIRKNHSNIHSVLVYPYKKDERFKILVFRVQTMNPMSVIEDLREEGHDVLWPSLPMNDQ
ncbi:acetoin utilization AcuB family protein [Jeotgalibacillus proteolyticus]|uniref:Acetoin utilization protein AcuB n=1 Tax=Jeotgalibacillus proteolyticus TaxID=2082395 RepID=A0A2S5GFH2_9BACL|nr:acetoin utilization AcuB family protein [Jeotgalibacillus proteolyticus]PPA71665.1 acetoin utilization protein AcuB [Jeotgalibacillus proteolyticus]